MLACAGVGIIAGSLFKGSYFDAMQEIVNSFGNNILNQILCFGSNEKLFLLLKVIIKRLIPFILVWLLSSTVAGKPYIIGMLAFNGFTAGFWCCFVGMSYGQEAIALIFAWYFPHLIFYAISYCISIIYITENYRSRKFMLISLLTALMLTGCVLETYINPIILRWAFS